MKKRIILIILIGVAFIIYKVSFTNKEVASLQEKHEKLIEKERVENGVPPNKYLEEQYVLTMNPYTGRTHPENLYQLQKKLKEQRAYQRRTPGDAIDNQWIERGPNNVGGRTRMVLFDPNDANHKRVFAGGVSGGLWVNNDITDENSSWTSVGIGENLSVTCMAVDPNDSQIMYLGTGELYQPQKALGNGIWKTIDGGVTWENIYKVRGNTTVASEINVPGTYYITDIIVRDGNGIKDATNDSEIFVSIGAVFYSLNPINTYVGLDNYGIHKSSDGGVNWSKITLEVDGKSVAGNDFEIGLDNTLWLATTTNFYGKGGGSVYSSADGNTFSLKHTIPNARRTEIAVSKQDANTIYTLARLKYVDGTGEEIAPFVTILKTDDAFDTATTLSLPNDADPGIASNNFTNNQAFYNLLIEVDPTDDAIAYVGGINLFRTTNSGTSWSQLSKRSPTATLPGITVSYVHADQHSWVFHPTDANISMIGNDGGVFYATSLSAASTSNTAIVERTKDYNTTQFYDAAISQTTDPEYIIGGTQDNGNLFFDEASEGVNTAIKVNRGDGTHSFIDKDGDYMIVSNLYNNIYRYNLPYTGSRVTVSSDSETGGFVNPMDLDENLDILYSNGGSHLARFTSITSSLPIRTNITDALLVNISAIKVSPFTTTSSKVFVGTRAGKVVKIENANTASQTITDISSSSFFGNVSSIEFGASENEIMVTFYNFGVKSIWFTENGGTTWADKEGDFPDINVRCILMNSLNNNEVIVGSELGVWNTSNFKSAAPKWNQSYNGMSNVAVLSLDLRTADNTILAATHGRGLYTGKFTGNTLTVWTGTIDANFTNPNNWSHGLPTTAVDVKIPETSNNPIINSSVSAANVSVEKNASLTINDVGAITIEENSTNEGEFIINSSIANSGSLLVKGTSTGNIIYNRFASGNWHLTSSPLQNETYDDAWVLANSIQHGSVDTNSRAIRTYNNNESKWDNMLVGDDKPFTQGKGFAVKRTIAGNTTFVGTIPENTVTISVDKGTSNAYNLIGNPFPSYLALNENADLSNNFLTLNSSVLSEMTIWYWREAEGYKTYNQTTSATYLAPGQAFFVKSKPLGDSVSFPETLQHHNSETFLKTPNNRPEIRLFFKKDKEVKYADIFYIDATTQGFDNGYDSTIFTGASSNFEIYTKLVNGEDDKNLAIQSIPKDFSIIIPVGIIAPENTEVEISITSKNLENGLEVYLEDKELSTFTLLKNEETGYKFASKEKVNGSGRFFLHTSAEILNIANENFKNLVLFSSDKKIHIKNLPSTKATFTLFNLNGKQLIKQKLNSKNEIISVDNLATSIYIVQIATDKGIFKRKLLVQ